MTRAAIEPEETEFRNPLHCFRCRGLRILRTDPPMKANVMASGLWSITGRDFSGTVRYHEGFPVICKECDGTGIGPWPFLCAEPDATMEHVTDLEPL